LRVHLALDAGHGLPTLDEGEKGAVLVLLWVRLAWAYNSPVETLTFKFADAARAGADSLVTIPEPSTGFSCSFPTTRRRRSSSFIRAGQACCSAAALQAVTQGPWS
jgi:hypothetical protein